MTKRYEQPFEENWVCYAYKEGPHEEYNVGPGMGAMQSILRSDLYNFGDWYDGVMTQYPAWKMCLGVDDTADSGYDGLPSSELLRGEVYYNTCGGIDGQCGDDFAGADDFDSPYP